MIRRGAGGAEDADAQDQPSPSKRTKYSSGGSAQKATDVAKIDDVAKVDVQKPRQPSEESGPTSCEKSPLAAGFATSDLRTPTSQKCAAVARRARI